MQHTICDTNLAESYTRALLGQLDMEQIRNWTYQVTITRSGKEHADPHCPRVRRITTDQTHTHRHIEQRHGPQRNEIETWTTDSTRSCCPPPTGPALDAIRNAQQLLRHGRELAEHTSIIQHIARGTAEGGVTVVDPRQMENALCYQTPAPTGWHPQAEAQLAHWLADLRQLEQQHVTPEIAIASYTRAVVEAVVGAIGWEEPDHPYSPHQKWVLGQLAQHDPNPHQLCRRILFDWQLAGTPINDNDSRTLDHVTRAALRQTSPTTTVWARGNRIRYATRSASDEQLGRLWARILGCDIGDTADRQPNLPHLVTTCLGIRQTRPTQQ